MKKGVVVAIILVVLSGCYCRRCWGQEEKVEVGKPVIMNATAVAQWKEDLFDGLNKISNNPYDTVANLLLVNGFGLAKVPQKNETVEVTAANYEKMQKVIRSIKAALGFALIQQVQVIEQNQDAVQAAIESATDTIKDESARKAFLEKAIILRGE